MRLYFTIAIIVLNSINCNGESQEEPKALDDVPNEKISFGLQQTLEKLENMTNEEKINALTELTYSANNFSLNLYKKIANRGRENVVLWSFGIFQSIGLVAQASTGDTKREIQEVLQLPQDESRIFAGFEEIHRRYKKRFYTSYAKNQLYITYDQTIRPDFKNISESIYSVKIFKSSEGSDESMTILAHGMHSCSIGSQGNMDAATFSNENGTRTQYKDFLRLIGKSRHGQLPEIQATFVEIPCMQYNPPRDGPTRMFILLPDRVNGLEELEKNIERLNINKLSKGDLHDVNITVPPMIEINKDMINDGLIGMGLGNMFSNNTEISLTALQTKIHKFWNSGALNVFADPDAPLGPGLSNETILEVTVDRPFIIIVTTDDENPLILHMARITSSENFG